MHTFWLSTKVPLGRLFPFIFAAFLSVSSASSRLPAARRYRADSGANCKEIHSKYIFDEWRY